MLHCSTGFAWNRYDLIQRMKTKAFNAFNPVNSTNPGLARTAPLTFGEFQQTTPPREMQFALRYEF